MAYSGSVAKMSEETFQYICTSCVEDDLIKEALKYCIECQRYCCKDCLASHRRIPILKGHTFLENSSANSQGGQSISLPALPTIQCSKHIGQIINMFCKKHHGVCCGICVATDHRLCEDLVSVPDTIDQLYSNTDTSNTASDIQDVLDETNEWSKDSDTLLSQLRDSKTTAIKDVKKFRIKVDTFLKKIEDASIKEIEDAYKRLESEIYEERKKCKDYMDSLSNLKKLMKQASGNIAQLFVCTKLAQDKISSINMNKRTAPTLETSEIRFIPSEELTTCIDKIRAIGNIAIKAERRNYQYKVTKKSNINFLLQGESYNSVLGSCIVDNTILFTDICNSMLTRFDILSSSMIDYCEVPGGPGGICKVSKHEVAVGCYENVQFVSIRNGLSLPHVIKTKHRCYGIAYYDDKMYITDHEKTLYMYDMSGNILKTITTDSNGASLFQSSRHIAFSVNGDKLYVGDYHNGLVCFNAQCDYIKTIDQSDVRSDGVCVDGYGNVIVANWKSTSIVLLDSDGEELGKIVNNTGRHPRSVCFHDALRRLFVTYQSSDVDVFHLP